MAMLQAARAETLGLTEPEAKSWGLNRAHFYAAAKRSGQNAKAFGTKNQNDPVYVLGGERAFRLRELSDGLVFKLGRETQTAEDFDLLICQSFADWDQAWSDALGLVQSADRRDLAIHSRFLTRIYQTNRDKLAKRWSQVTAPAPVSPDQAAA